MPNRASGGSWLRLASSSRLATSSEPAARHAPGAVDDVGERPGAFPGAEELGPRPDAPADPAPRAAAGPAAPPEPRAGQDAEAAGLRAGQGPLRGVGRGRAGQDLREQGVGRRVARSRPPSSGRRPRERLDQPLAPELAGAPPPASGRRPVVDRAELAAQRPGRAPARRGAPRSRPPARPSAAAPRGTSRVLASDLGSVRGDRPIFESEAVHGRASAGFVGVRGEVGGRRPSSANRGAGSHRRRRGAGDRPSRCIRARKSDEGGDGEPRPSSRARGAEASPRLRRGGGRADATGGRLARRSGGPGGPVPRLVAHPLEERADEPDASPPGRAGPPGSPGRGRRGRTDRPPGRRPRPPSGGGRCRRHPGGTGGRVAPRPGRGAPGIAPGWSQRSRNPTRAGGPASAEPPGTRRGRPASARLVGRGRRGPRPGASGPSAAANAVPRSHDHGVIISAGPTALRHCPGRPGGSRPRRPRSRSRSPGRPARSEGRRRPRGGRGAGGPPGSARSAGAGRRAVEVGHDGPAQPERLQVAQVVRLGADQRSFSRSVIRRGAVGSARPGPGPRRAAPRGWPAGEVQVRLAPSAPGTSGRRRPGAGRPCRASA